MQRIASELKHQLNALDSEALQEAERFFEWAISYERKGLRIAADAMRDEGRKAFDKYLRYSRA